MKDSNSHRKDAEPKIRNDTLRRITVMVISVQKPQDNANEKTRFDDRATLIESCISQAATKTKSQKMLHAWSATVRAIFLVYSRRQVDAETPAEYDF